MSNQTGEFRTLKKVRLIQQFDTKTTSNGKNYYMCKVKMTDDKIESEHGAREFFIDEYKLPSEESFVPKLEFKKVYDIGPVMFSSNFANSTKDHWVVIKTTKATVIEQEVETMEDLDTLGIDPEYLEPESEKPKTPLTIDERLDNIDSSLENIQVTMDTMLKVFQQLMSKLKEMSK